jgi:hypothetical protein
VEHADLAAVLALVPVREIAFPVAISRYPQP